MGRLMHDEAPHGAILNEDHLICKEQVQNPEAPVVVLCVSLLLGWRLPRRLRLAKCWGCRSRDWWWWGLAGDTS